MHVALGSLPDWIEAAGTSAAFIAIAVTLWRDARWRRQDGADRARAAGAELLAAVVALRTSVKADRRFLPPRLRIPFRGSPLGPVGPRYEALAHRLEAAAISVSIHKVAELTDASWSLASAAESLVVGIDLSATEFARAEDTLDAATVAFRAQVDRL